MKAVSWNWKLRRVREGAAALPAKLRKIGGTGDPDRWEARARVRRPLLKELARQNGMGGSDWRDQSVSGAPTRIPREIHSDRISRGS